MGNSRCFANVPGVYAVTAAPGFFDNASRRCNLLRCDCVFEGIRVEAVEPVRTTLGLRVHQESELRPLRTRQRDVVRNVIGEPVAFPRAEQRLARIHHLGIGRAPGCPAALPARPCARRPDRSATQPMPARNDLGPAMLRLSDHLGAGAEALVAELATAQRGCRKRRGREARPRALGPHRAR